MWYMHFVEGTKASEEPMVISTKRTKHLEGCHCDFNYCCFSYYYMFTILDFY